MAQRPITMEQLKQILQLKNAGIGIREIARRIGISRNSVRKYLSQLDAGADDLTNKELADKAYNNEQLESNTQRKLQLLEHFKYAESELVKTGVTRLLLWNEYLAKHPEGYAYSQYCDQFKQYLKHKDVSMHLEYKPADIMMVDFAGKKQYYIDTSTGERIQCEVFVAILPFSGLIFCHAVLSQKTHDFAACINAMLLFYAGVPATILCDNLKTAVIRSDRYEPVFTDLCYQLSEHYSTTFTAASLIVLRIKPWLNKPFALYMLMYMRHCATRCSPA